MSPVEKSMCMPTVDAARAEKCEPVCNGVGAIQAATIETCCKCRCADGLGAVMNTGRIRKRAKAHHGKSNRHRWLVAYDAARVVGLRNGKTRLMAQDLRVTKMTLTRYAQAWVFYRDLTRALFAGNASDTLLKPLRNARNDLGLKHFYVLGVYARLNDMTVLDCVAQLTTASGQGASTEEMMVHIYGEDGKPAPPRKWPATTRKAKGKYGKRGYMLTVYIDELFDDSPNYGTPVTLTEERTAPAAGRAEAEVGA